MRMDCNYFTDRCGSFSENRDSSLANIVHYYSIGDFANSLMLIAEVEVQRYFEKLSMAKLT